jgi:ADP-heptose:LPS heptosyltransferase
MQILLRFGYLGDSITAIRAAESLDAQLFLCENYQSFLGLSSSKNKGNILSDFFSSLSKKNNVSSGNIFDLKRFAKKNNVTQILIMVQSPTIKFSIIRSLCEFFLRIPVRIIFDASQWIYYDIQKNNINAKKYLRNLKKKSNLKFVINWEGKEEVKNLNQETIEFICNIILSTYQKPMITIIGKSRIQLTNSNLISISNLSGKITLTQMKDLIQLCDCIITTDSGPLHLAAFFKKMIVALIPPRYPLAYWYPFGSNIALVSDYLIPCRQIKCTSCNEYKNICINGEIAKKNLEDLFN